MTEPNRDEVLAQSLAAEERFKQGLPEPREVSETGELAAILAALPENTPLFLGDQVVSRPDLSGTEVLQAVVAHWTPCAEPADPDAPRGLHRMMPALGLTTVQTEWGQNPGAEFRDHKDELLPVEASDRAETRLTDGDLEGGIKDAADAIDLIAHLLDEGADFIPHGHDAHTTVQVETSRLRQAAERLRKIAPDAQKASDQ
ncbi:hypothetical protein [Streptomyces sp. BH105]|uniref:hypothetical protein n=1 Tax=Streptomyces sp. BH105 TaxID=3410408 RepID=UPI003CFA4ABC